MIHWGLPMMLREALKQEIDTLNENQLSKIAKYISSIKIRPQQLKNNKPFWQRATPAKRSQDFKGWVAGLPKTGVSLPNEAFNRDSIYE